LTQLERMFLFFMVQAIFFYPKHMCNTITLTRVCLFKYLLWDRRR